jgi:hypothetical protein
MTTVELTLEQLSKRVKLSRARCDEFVEACKVCLEDQQHHPGVVLKVDGFSPCIFQLTWESPVTIAAVDSWADPDEATEHGACAIAFFVILEITKLMVIRRSRKKTGVDYWLTHKDNTLLQNSARLEISGIRKDSQSVINSRVVRKKKQTKQSDITHAALPAYVVVVEFSNPVSHVEVRHAGT